MELFNTVIGRACGFLSYSNIWWAGIFLENAQLTADVYAKCEPLEFISNFEIS